MKKTSNFWAASLKNESNLLVWITVCMGTNCNLFRRTVLEMPESKQLSFRLRLVRRIFQHPAIQTKIVQHFGKIFHHIKVRQPIGRRILSKPWSEQAGGWIIFCKKRLRTLKSFQIFKTEIKKPKTLSGWCPFQGLPNGTTLMQILSGWTVPLNGC